MFLSFVEAAEFLVPFRLQHIGHQTVGGIDLHEPLLRQVGFVAGSLDLLTAQPVHFLQAALQLLLDG